MRKIFGKPWTLRGIIMAIIIFLMAIFECVSLLGSTMISRSIERQKKDSYASVLDIYSGNLEEEMEQIDNFLLSSVRIEGNVREVMESTTKLDCYLAQIRMEQTFREETRYMSHLTGAVWYAPHMDIRVKMINNSGSPFLENFQENLDRAVEKMEEENTADWFFLPVGEDCYLVRVLQNQNTYMTGWIDTRAIFQNMEEVLTDKSGELYLYTGGELLGNKNNQLKLQQVNLNLESGNWREDSNTLMICPQNTYRVTPCLSLSKKELYDYFVNPYVIVPMVFLITGILLVLLSFEISKYFIQPMNSLQKAMVKMQEGDLNVRVDNSSAFYEITLLNNNFDRMAEKIKELKITVYEKQLEKQAVELQYYQHQINPHFLTNCMNTIRSLLVMGKSKEAEEFTTLLSRNIRYELSAKEKVSLQEEINHVNNYIALQQIRYEDQLCLHTQIQEELLTFSVPNMIIQTFAENSVKHQMCPDELLKISILAEKREDKIYIEVIDNGEGFAPDILEQLRNGEKVVKNGVEHIGIENVVRRLELMYQGQAQIMFSNIQKGAKVEIWLPEGRHYE